VAVIALIAVVVGVSRGARRAGDSRAAAAVAPRRRRRQEGRRHHQGVGSSFWQTMCRRPQAGPYGAEVGLFGPTSETDVNPARSTDRESISRGADAIRLAPNSSDALEQPRSMRARDGGTKVVVVDTRGDDPTPEGFIRHRQRQGRRAGRQTLCELATKAGKCPAAC